MSSIAASARSLSWGGSAVRRARAVLVTETGALLLAFTALRLIAAIHGPATYSDTGTYTAVDFLGGVERLWTVPALWAVISGEAAREGVQILLGIVAWCALAAALSEMLEVLWVRRLGLLAVLVLALVPQVTAWDSVLLSESVSSSLLVLLVALLLRASARPRRATLIGCLAVATLWMFTRQLNVLLFLCLLPFVLGFTVLRGPREHRVWVAAALVAIGVWGGVALVRNTNDAGGVWKWNALQILENRIAPDPGALRFFEDRGLPKSPTILAERGAFPGSMSPLFSDPAVMAWVENHYQSTYLGYLMRHLPHTLLEPFKQMPAAISTSLDGGYKARPVLPGTFADTVWGNGDVGAVPFWVVVAATLALACLARGLLRWIPSLVPLLLIAAAIGTVLTWTLTGYGGGSELGRLFLPVALLLRLGLLLLITFSADALLRPAPSRVREEGGCAA